MTSWKEDYNGYRPHLALDNMTPNEFALKSSLEKQAAKGQKRNSGLSLKPEEKRVSGQAESADLGWETREPYPFSAGG
ncbi:hypothetical protein [Bosea sp. LjRoot9]|uniref:hypothetical protein n=1 Tax=Bosea sp. LjRoot9 TaxID=3342341 RepID=UPI003F4FEE16